MLRIRKKPTEAVGHIPLVFEYVVLEFMQANKFTIGPGRTVRSVSGIYAQAERFHVLWHRLKWFSLTNK